MKIISFLKNKENWYIFISVIFTIIILVGIINYLPKGCKTKKQPDLITNNIDLLPQPNDNSIITPSSNSSNYSTTSPSPDTSNVLITENTTKTQETQKNSEPIVNTTPISDFYISTLAPINGSFITGDNIILAFSTSNYSYSVITEISSILPDKSVIKQTFPINIPAKNSFSLAHTLKISFDANAKEIKANLYLVDINNKVINQSLSWYK